MIGAPARDIGRVGGQRGASGALGQLREDDRLFPVVVNVQEAREAPAEIGEVSAIALGHGSVGDAHDRVEAAAKGGVDPRTAWAINSYGAEAFIAHTIRDSDEKKRLALWSSRSAWNTPNGSAT